MAPPPPPGPPGPPGPPKPPGPPGPPGLPATPPAVIPIEELLKQKIDDFNQSKNTVSSKIKDKGGNYNEINNAFEIYSRARRLLLSEMRKAIKIFDQQKSKQKREQDHKGWESIFNYFVLIGKDGNKQEEINNWQASNTDELKKKAKLLTDLIETFKSDPELTTENKSLLNDTIQNNFLDENQNIMKQLNGMRNEPKGGDKEGKILEKGKVFFQNFVNMYNKFEKIRKTLPQKKNEEKGKIQRFKTDFLHQLFTFCLESIQLDILQKNKVSDIQLKFGSETSPLLEIYNERKKLKKKGFTPSKSNSSDDGRKNMFAQIISGNHVLKKTEQQSKPAATTQADDTNNLMGVVNKALAKMNVRINDDDDDDDDSDWSDDGDKNKGTEKSTQNIN